jgi:hypothetical protein
MRVSISQLVERSMVLVLCLAALSSAAYGQSLRDRMVGTWTLVSWGTLSGGVEVPVPMSAGATGIITYSPDGYMCVNIMGANRPKFASPDFMGGSVNEKAAAFETFVGYCGRYEVNEQERFVTHTLQTSWYPNWTGSGQKRFVEMSGNRIRLTAPPILAQGEQVVGVLVWERVR